jgi:transposase
MGKEKIITASKVTAYLEKQCLASGEAVALSNTRFDRIIPRAGRLALILRWQWYID